jgi:hypothetical protein
VARPSERLSAPRTLGGFRPTGVATGAVPLPRSGRGLGLRRRRGRYRRRGSHGRRACHRLGRLGAGRRGPDARRPRHPRREGHHGDAADAGRDGNDARRPPGRRADALARGLRRRARTEALERGVDRGRGIGHAEHLVLAAVLVGAHPERLEQVLEARVEVVDGLLEAA